MWPAAVAAGDAPQPLAELASEEAVDEEVAGGVEDDEEVGEDEEVEAGRLREDGRVDGVDDVDAEGGHGADEEDEDDCERNDGEVLLASLPRLHREPAAAAAAQRRHEARVEEDEQAEREEEEEDGVEDARVDVAVERRLRDGRLGELRRAVGHHLDVELKVARRVVGGGGDDDDGDGAADARQRADGGGAQREADGDVALGGHEHRQPDGDHLRGHEHRPDGELDGGAVPEARLEDANERVDVDGRLDEQHAEQEDEVGGGDGAQHEEHRRAAERLREHDARQRASEQAEHAARARQPDARHVGEVESVRRRPRRVGGAGGRRWRRRGDVPRQPGRRVGHHRGRMSAAAAAVRREGPRAADGGAGGGGGGSQEEDFQQEQRKARHLKRSSRVVRSRRCVSDESVRSTFYRFSGYVFCSADARLCVCGGVRR